MGLHDVTYYYTLCVKTLADIPVNDGDNLADINNCLWL